VPFNLSNYVLGGTAVKPGHFFLGTLALLPMCLFFVYLGTTASNIQDVVSGDHEISMMEIIISVVGTTIALIGICAVSCTVRRTINE